MTQHALALLLFLRAFASGEQSQDVREALRAYLESRGCAKVVTAMQSRADLRLVEITVECREKKREDGP